MIAILTTSAALTTGNLILRKKKRDKAKIDAKAMFEEHGYELEDKDLNKIFRYYLGETSIDALDNAIEDFRERVCQFIPLMNIYFIIQNIKYMNGKKSSTDYYHNYSNWDLYNRTIEGVNVLERLEDEINLKNNNPKEISEETKTSTVAPTTYPTPIKRDVSKLVLSPNQNESK